MTSTSVTRCYVSPAAQRSRSSWLGFIVISAINYNMLKDEGYENIDANCNDQVFIPKEGVLAE